MIPGRAVIVITSILAVGVYYCAAAAISSPLTTASDARLRVAHAARPAAHPLQCWPGPAPGAEGRCATDALGSAYCKSVKCARDRNLLPRSGISVRDPFVVVRRNEAGSALACTLL